MNSRHPKPVSSVFPVEKLRLFRALKEKWREGYTTSDLKADLMSGTVVAMVAVPLGMALAIASGVAPQCGLYTVIVGGGLVALLGGSRFQVTGPTAAFVVILAPIAQRFGYSGLLVAGFLAGLLLILMGLAGLGRLIQFIPYPVTTGFTSGIAVVIAILQVKDFFGIQIEHMPERFWDKVMVLFSSLPTFSVHELAVGLSTLTLLVIWPKISRRVPAPLVALGSVSVAVISLQYFFPELDVATIGSRFFYSIDGVTGSGIPQTLPHFNWPWNFVGQDQVMFQFSLENLESLVPSAFAIAMLGAIESLLSAVVADGMAQTKHDPDGELVALGFGNILAPFFGGIPATGAIARTTTNIRFGARSPLSSVFHAVFTLLTILFFAPFVAYLPMASLAALLLLVAYNMSERKHFVHILKVAPKSDVIVLLICFFLTVLFDMVVGVSVGIVLAALLFMKRMAEVTEATKLVDHTRSLGDGFDLPANWVLYEIAGPLFFGAAEKAAGTIMTASDNMKGVVFIMSSVPVMDMTGLVALESAIRKLSAKSKSVCLVGLKTQPQTLLRKSGLLDESKGVMVFRDLGEMTHYFKKA